MIDSQCPEQFLVNILYLLCQSLELGVSGPKGPEGDWLQCQNEAQATANNALTTC